MPAVDRSNHFRGMEMFSNQVTLWVIWYCSVAQLCPICCDILDCSPLGFSVHEISQATILECLPFPPAEDLPDPGIEPTSPALAGGFFTTSATWESKVTLLVEQLHIYVHTGTQTQILQFHTLVSWFCDWKLSLSRALTDHTCVIKEICWSLEDTAFVLALNQWYN